MQGQPSRPRCHHVGPPRHAPKPKVKALRPGHAPHSPTRRDNHPQAAAHSMLNLAPKRRLGLPPRPLTARPTNPNHRRVEPLPEAGSHDSRADRSRRGVVGNKNHARNARVRAQPSRQAPRPPPHSHRHNTAPQRAPGSLAPHRRVRYPLRPLAGRPPHPHHRSHAYKPEARPMQRDAARSRRTQVDNPHHARHTTIHGHAPRHASNLHHHTQRRHPAPQRTRRTQTPH
mmetsp:Transcript_58208/g.153077  ORF Transcript_58208/g.153077 Transcript_58208/m.153077 type:complete len:229 (-) Transcript_58208:1687-2373(-)